MLQKRMSLALKKDRRDVSLMLMLLSSSNSSTSVPVRVKVTNSIDETQRLYYP